MENEVDRLMAAYVKIRDKKSAESKSFKGAEKVLKAQMGVIEDRFKVICADLGTTSLKTDHGTASLTKKDYVKVLDWTAVIEYVKEHELYHMLTQNVKKDEVKDFMASNDNALPPGIEYGANQVIQVRRPTKKKGD